MVSQRKKKMEDGGVSKQKVLRKRMIEKTKMAGRGGKKIQHLDRKRVSQKYGLEGHKRACGDNFRVEGGRKKKLGPDYWIGGTKGNKKGLSEDTCT